MALAPAHILPSLLVVPDVSATVMAAVGFVQVPGTVVIAADEGLNIVLSVSQTHLVSMV